MCSGTTVGPIPSRTKQTRSGCIFFAQLRRGRNEESTRSVFRNVYVDTQKGHVCSLAPCISLCLHNACVQTTFLVTRSAAAAAVSDPTKHYCWCTAHCTRLRSWPSPNAPPLLLRGGLSLSCLLPCTPLKDAMMERRQHAYNPQRTKHWRGVTNILLRRGPDQGCVRVREQQAVSKLLLSFLLMPPQRQGSTHSNDASGKLSLRLTFSLSH